MVVVFSLYHSGRNDGTPKMFGFFFPFLFHFLAHPFLRAHVNFAGCPHYLLIMIFLRIHHLFLYPDWHVSNAPLTIVVFSNDHHHP